MHLLNTDRGYHLTLQESLITTLAPIPYAISHYKEAKQSNGLTAIGHYALAIAECIPIIGHLAAMIEIVAVKILYTFGLIHVKNISQEQSSLKDKAHSLPLSQESIQTQPTPAKEAKPSKITLIPPENESPPQPSHTEPNSLSEQPNKPNPASEKSTHTEETKSSTKPQEHPSTSISEHTAKKDSWILSNVSKVALGIAGLSSALLAGYGLYLYLRSDQEYDLDQLPMLSSSITSPSPTDGIEGGTPNSTSWIEQAANIVSNRLEEIQDSIVNTTNSASSLFSNQTTLAEGQSCFYSKAVTLYKPAQKASSFIAQVTSNTLSNISSWMPSLLDGNKMMKTAINEFQARFREFVFSSSNEISKAVTLYKPAQQVYHPIIQVASQALCNISSTTSSLLNELPESLKERVTQIGMNAGEQAETATCLNTNLFAIKEFLKTHAFSSFKLLGAIIPTYVLSKFIFPWTIEQTFISHANRRSWLNEWLNHNCGKKEEPNPNTASTPLTLTNNQRPYYSSVAASWLPTIPFNQSQDSKTQLRDAPKDALTEATTYPPQSPTQKDFDYYTFLRHTIFDKFKCVNGECIVESLKREFPNQLVNQTIKNDPTIRFYIEQLINKEFLNDDFVDDIWGAILDYLEQKSPNTHGTQSQQSKNRNPISGVGSKAPRRNPYKYLKNLRHSQK